MELKTKNFVKEDNFSSRITESKLDKNYVNWKIKYIDKLRLMNWSEQN